MNGIDSGLIGNALGTLVSVDVVRGKRRLGGVSSRVVAFASALVLVAASVYALAGPTFADRIVRVSAPTSAGSAYNLTVEIPALAPEPVPTLIADVTGAGAAFTGFSSADRLITCTFPRANHATCEVPNGMLPRATMFTLTVAPHTTGMITAKIFLDIHTDTQTAITRTEAVPLAR